VQIGSLVIDPPVIAAPMSGISDRSFRLICREHGARLVYTGLVSANALHHRNAKTDDLLVLRPDEHPVCVQVFGADPDVVARAAALAEGHGADMIDINMGCSVPKVLKGAAGAALMADAERAEAMVRAVARAVSAPVGVKLRTGWRDRGEDATALAPRLQDAGASVAVIHPRWVGQRFGGSADWSVIARVKAAVEIPVIGSGDIHCGADALRMKSETECDGVMIGRSARGNPWVFREAAAVLKGEPLPAEPSVKDRVVAAARHLSLVVEDKGQKLGVLQMRKHIAWYLRGVPGARALRERVNRAKTEADLMDVLEAAGDSSNVTEALVAYQ
jgi:nifR3 family TIM-barrel protein